MTFAPLLRPQSSWQPSARAPGSIFTSPRRWTTGADLGPPSATTSFVPDADAALGRDEPKRELTTPGPGPDAIPKDPAQNVERTGAPDRIGVRTILRPGRLPETLLGVGDPPQAFDRSARSIVAPGGAPTVNNAAAANDCTPSAAGTVLGWNVVSADAGHWRPDVTSLALAGRVNVHPWPSLPTTKSVPNTPNPIAGGNIDNTAGSNHWQTAIDDMADYHTAGGGAGPNWHSTAASSAHEWAHWNADWVIDSVASAAGGNWPQANADIDALRQSKATSKTAAAARAALRPRVEARLRTWRTRAVTRWNAIPDSPGVAGSTGYDAGKVVLNGHIAAIRAFATAQGWTGPAPAPAGGAPAGAAPATGGLSRGAKFGIGALGGALAGAGIGAFFGPVGALVGAGIGALVGGIGSLFF
jgi:hypothetical protein